MASNTETQTANVPDPTETVRDTQRTLTMEYIGRIVDKRFTQALTEVENRFTSRLEQLLQARPNPTAGSASPASSSSSTGPPQFDPLAPPFVPNESAQQQEDAAAAAPNAD